jgi:hypothetical protein
MKLGRRLTFAVSIGIGTVIETAYIISRFLP